MLELPGIPPDHRWVYGPGPNYPRLTLEKFVGKKWQYVNGRAVFPDLHSDDEQSAATYAANQILKEIKYNDYLENNPNYGVYQSFRTGP